MATLEIIGGGTSDGGGTPTDEYVNITGDTMLGNLDMSNNRITRVAAAVSASDVVVKSQLDTKLDIGGGVMSGSLTLSGDPTTTYQAATKQYVDTKASLTGSNTFSGSNVFTTTPEIRNTLLLNTVGVSSVWLRPGLSNALYALDVVNPSSGALAPVNIGYPQDSDDAARVDWVGANYSLLGHNHDSSYLSPTEIIAGTNITIDTTTTPGSVIINNPAHNHDSSYLATTEVVAGTNVTVDRVTMPGSVIISSPDEVITLSGSDPVPAGTPAGTVIVRY
jgi:hypothetical protein